MDRDSRDDWRGFEPGAIPSKTDVPDLEGFLHRLPRGSRVLDLGCGTGRVSRLIETQGFEVTGIDINRAAIEEARVLCSERARFLVRDVASDAGLDLGEAAFGAVVCQLVISIVGGASERLSLLRNAHDVLVPGGLLYLSASGVSDDLNPKYRALYEADASETGELYSYFSRDEKGKVLYLTHHFQQVELEELLRSAGFETSSLVKRKETSSRRPDEAAYFLYALAGRSEG